MTIDTACFTTVANSLTALSQIKVNVYNVIPTMFSDLMAYASIKMNFVIKWTRMEPVLCVCKTTTILRSYSDV